MTRSRRAERLGLCLLLAGCATTSSGGRSNGEESLAGWQALDEGRGADAVKIFERRLAQHPNDPIARFGRATIAYERGATEEAVDGYAAVLGVLASGGDGSPAHTFWGPVLAPVAAGRLLALYDEVGPATRRRLLAALRPQELARGPGLAFSWQARVELIRLAQQAARQAVDADLLVRSAADGGCAQHVFDVGRLGPLPTLDLDAKPPAALLAGPEKWRPVTTSGCRLTLAASPDGRGGARLLRATVEVAAGTYDLVLDFPGEGMVRIEGGEWSGAHGSSRGHGPRTTVRRLTLPAGRYPIEIRIASRGGEAQLALMVLPRASGTWARFVDPREVVANPRRVPQLSIGPLPFERTPAAGPPGAQALADYCDVYAAERLGEVDAAMAALERLRARPRFALGLSAGGAVAREDPTRPASLARDAARRLLRAAVAIDTDLARAWHVLGMLELEDDRTRDATEAARAAARAAPGWWAPDLLLARGGRVRGLDFDAVRALAEAEKKTAGNRPCPVLEALYRQAHEQRQIEKEAPLVDALAACGGAVEARLERLRARGELGQAIAMLKRALRLEPERDDLAGELALLLSAAGRPEEALAELTGLVTREPAEPLHRVRLADAQAAAGQVQEARATVGAALLSRPDFPEVRRAARALGVGLPLDGFRVEGRAAIRAFETAGVRYTSPSVTVLDRSVMRAFASGALMVLTHQIVRVDSKDGIDRWGEIAVPPGADILTLRTHKVDGSTREPEEIAGKETISAPDLAIGDYVEWELLEAHAPSQAFAPGFVTDRFFFQSFDSPLARSELVLVTPAGVVLDTDHRAKAPRAVTAAGAGGTTVTSFIAAGVPQLFAERAAVPAIEYVPSVRISSGVGWNGWARYLAQEMHDATRSSRDIRALAAQITRSAPDDRARIQAMVEWVTKNIEDGEDLIDPATFTLARGRGSRIALVVALARTLGLRAFPVLARSRLLADAGAPAPPQELDDFADALVEFQLSAGPSKGPAPPAMGSGVTVIHADLRLKHAALGYLPPGLDGAKILALSDGRFGHARSTGTEDRRTVDMTIRLDEQGAAVAVATEELAGWPALEWAELVDRLGADRARLRQDFEQRWLGVQFPGARLRELEVDLPRDGTGRRGTARVRYSFVSTRLAVPVTSSAAALDQSATGVREMRIEPTFFRSQPGRRFAAESQRATALMLGFDVPVRLTATVELPGTARVDEAGLHKDVVIRRTGGYRFVEEREVRAVRPGGPNVLVLRRESTLPIMRVLPEQYPSVAADLRRVDGAEQEAIRIRIGGAQR